MSIKKLNAKQLRELAKSKNIHIPKGGMSLTKMCKYFEEEDQGRVMREDQMREVAKYLGVPLRASTYKKSILIDRLVKSGKISKENALKYLWHWYDVIQLKDKLANLEKKTVSFSKLQEQYKSRVELPREFRQRVEKLKNVKPTYIKTNVEYDQLREIYGAIIDAIKQHPHGIIAEEIATFKDEIEPVIVARMDRLKELTTLAKTPDVFKTFGSKFDWERYKSRERQDPIIAEKWNNFTDTKKISFEGLSDTARGILCPSCMIGSKSILLTLLYIIRCI
jgi:polyhydroxyalkanoate synthesis regulator phasin